MHVLITADTVGGVWTYTQELATGLLARGHQVTLASFGRLPSSEQSSWAESQPGLDYRPTEYRLEWMEVAATEIEESKIFLQMLIDEIRPDVLHFSQYCYGDLRVDIPKIVVAHSDVVSWWVSVHGKPPEDSAWLRWYRNTVRNGLRGADFVVAPSRWMIEALSEYYVQPSNGTVIHNGRSPELFAVHQQKENIAVTVGRLWDAGKNASLLLRHDLAIQGEFAMPIFIAGRRDNPQSIENTSNPEFADKHNVHFAGELSQPQIAELFSRAGVYIGTSCYEPFGLAPLEAALSHCALVLNDIPTFRELWGEAALYFTLNDAADLARILRQLRENPAIQKEYGQLAYQLAIKKFAAQDMLTEYEHLYQNVASTEKAL
jgi:glycogen synthase